MTIRNLFATTFFTVFGLAQTVSAQQGATAPSEATAPAADPYLQAVGRGLTAMQAGDRARAIDAFRQAIEADATRGEAVCLFAEAQRLAGDLDAALEAFRGCARIGRAANDQRSVARGLHGVASTLERMTGHITDARAAWIEYVRFADGAAAFAPAAVGRSRTTSIDTIIELDRVSAEVRQRIADRERERASAHPQSGQPQPAQPARGAARHP